MNGLWLDGLNYPILSGSVNKAGVALQDLLKVLWQNSR